MAFQSSCETGMVDYGLEGPRWGTGAMGSSGGTVTWAVSGSVPAGFTPVIAAAFADWTAHANIAFQQVSATAGANIVFADNPIDGPSNTLGTTNYSYSGAQFRSATVTFDSGEGWHGSGSRIVSTNNADLFLVALHEIGHAIGLDHYNATPAVMNAVLTSSVTDLVASDIHGIQALYGPPKATGAWASLVDNVYYRSHSPDVAAAGTDPGTHYDQNGWHEGRDPNAFFSTVGYLAANSDVRAALVNPLTQYDTGGWHEGRDPSAGFDNELYLARNPDVRAAGIDPLAHYLHYGQAEGRQAYAAVGRAADLGTHPGFDAEYYLLANADVARAAIAAGGDGFAFAYNHYETNGWHEGRNPNAVFDVAGYLAAYGDVRAAGIDPLAHYETYGWREGRDPSATFDAKAYGANYADVAAAHVDPMLHYLQYGGVEGRSAFSDGHFG